MRAIKLLGVYLLFTTAIFSIFLSLDVVVRTGVIGVSLLLAFLLAEGGDKHCTDLRTCRVNSIFMYATLPIIWAVFFFNNQAPSVVILSSTGMEPALEKSDLMFVEQGDRSLIRGDVVLFLHKRKQRVSRIIAAPGDRIRIDGGIVYLNGNALKESYIYHQAGTDFMSERTVPMEKYFLLGDNRITATDSRKLGFVDKGSIIGTISLGYRQGRIESKSFLRGLAGVILLVTFVILPYRFYLRTRRSKIQRLLTIFHFTAALDVLLVVTIAEFILAERLQIRIVHLPIAVCQASLKLAEYIFLDNQLSVTVLVVLCLVGGGVTLNRFFLRARE